MIVYSCSGLPCGGFMKLLIADDHTLFLEALVQYIERFDPNATVVVASDLYQVFEKIDADPHWDLVILDLRMPGMHNLEGLTSFRKRYPENPVALISGIAEQEDVLRALDLGAVGYFPKTMSTKALLGGIQQVLAGHKFVPEGNATPFMPSYYADISVQTPIENATSQALKDARLTPRETEVLSYLVSGLSNKEIAKATDLQIVTIKLHVRGICRKLEVKNRTQAALKAQSFGVAAASHAAQS